MDSAQVVVTLYNLFYGIVSGGLAIFFMVVGYWVFDALTPNVDFDSELSKGNIAVGVMLSGIFIGVGVAVGTVLGKALN